MIAMQSLLLTEIYTLRCKVDLMTPSLEGGIAYTAKIMKATDRLIATVEDDG